MDPLSRSRLFFYALPWLIIQIVNLPIVNFVPGYYSSDLGVPLLQISTVLLLSRALDIFTDPLMGMLTDATRSRIGRRKPWIILGAPVTMLGAWLLFVPPVRPDAIYLFIAISITYLGFTMIQISYVSWGAELSGDYDERSRIVSWREGIGVLGTLAAISSPLIVMLFGGEGLAPALKGLAVAVLLLLPLLLAPALLMVPEPAPVAQQTRLSLREGFGAVLRNRELLWFLIACFITFLGIAPGGATGYLMMKHTFNAEALYPFLVFGEFITMLIFLPLWVWLSGRLGKHKAIALGILWMALFTFPVPWAGYLSPESVVVLATVRGIGFGALFVIPYSMFADIIDLDTLRTRRQRSGLFMAIGGMNLKFALMLGVALATAWPAFFGFEPSAAVNTGAAEFQVAVSYAWITCFFLCIAAPLFWFFPYSKARHAEVRRQLEAEIGRQ